MALTITRNTNGDADIISTAGELPLAQYNVPNGTAGVSTDPTYANTVVITSPALPTGKLSIALSKITTINGSAPPGTLSAVITLLGDSVFFRKATAGGGAITSAQMQAYYAANGGYSITFTDGSAGRISVIGNYEDGSATIQITKP